MFDGTDDYVQVPGLLPLLNEDLTFVCLFKRQNNNAMLLDVGHPSGYQRRYFAVTSSNNLRFSTHGNILDSISKINASQWYWAAATLAGLDAKIYINGALENSATFTAKADVSTHDLKIGRYVGSNAMVFQGRIAFVGIWNRVLTQQEIQDIQNGIVPSDALFKTNCSEGDGITAYDSSGNGNHGTIYNATLSTFHATDSSITNNDANETGHGKYYEAVNLSPYPNRYAWDTGITGDLGQQVTLFCWLVFYSNQAIDRDQFVASKYWTENEFSFYLNQDESLVLSLGNGIYAKTASVAGLIVLGAPTLVAVTIDLTTDTCKFYFNGSNVPTVINSKLNLVTSVYSTSPIRIGADPGRSSVQGTYLGAGILSKVLSASEIADLYAATANLDGLTNHPTFGNAFIGLWKAEYSDVWPDLSGNGHDATRDLTHPNAYRTIVVPAKSSTKTIWDTDLNCVGKCPHPVAVETPGITNHDGTVYLSAPHLTGSETVTSYEGTGVPTVTAGRIGWPSGTTISQIVLSDGTHYVAQEGPGTSNTNRTVYDVSGGGNHATLISGTVATIWGTRILTAADHCIEYGGRIGAEGEFVPGLLSGSSAADGNAITLTAGKHGNPFSRLTWNPFEAAEFNGRSLPTAYAPGDVLAVTPADSAFRRTKADGDDRLLVFADALTGNDLTNAQNYTA